MAQEPQDEESEQSDEKPEPRKQPKAAIPSPRGQGNYFTIYKKGQGYWTRMGTVGAAALIGILAAQFVWEQRDNFGVKSSNGGYLLVAAFCAVWAGICFHYMNKPGNVDFLIATDSEMKKVNWTSRQELTGSTKIVILFMFVIAIVLFLYDMLFSTLFYLIHVLKIPPPFWPDQK